MAIETTNREATDGQMKLKYTTVNQIKKPSLICNQIGQNKAEICHKQT